MWTGAATVISNVHSGARAPGVNAGYSDVTITRRRKQFVYGVPGFNKTIPSLLSTHALQWLRKHYVWRHFVPSGVASPLGSGSGVESLVSTRERGRRGAVLSPGICSWCLFNYAQYVGEAFHAAFWQEISEFELIVVDDMALLTTRRASK